MLSRWSPKTGNNCREILTYYFLFLKSFEVEVLDETKILQKYLEILEHNSHRRGLGIENQPASFQPTVYPWTYGLFQPLSLTLKWEFGAGGPCQSARLGFLPLLTGRCMPCANHTDEWKNHWIILDCLHQPPYPECQCSLHFVRSL